MCVYIKVCECVYCKEFEALTVLYELYVLNRTFYVCSDHFKNQRDTSINAFQLKIRKSQIFESLSKLQVRFKHLNLPQKPISNNVTVVYVTDPLRKHYSIIMLTLYPLMTTLLVIWPN